MADEYTSASSMSEPEENKEQVPFRGVKNIPPGKQINGFTGELEDAPPINLSASPADQRILAAAPHTEPLPVLIDRAINHRGDAGVDVDTHVGPSLTEDALPGQTPLPVIRPYDTPNQQDDPLPTQHTDVPPPNDIAVDAGAPVQREGVHYPGQDTKEFVESINARKEAEAKHDELPEIKPPVSGDDLNKSDDDKKSDEDKGDTDV